MSKRTRMILAVFLVFSLVIGQAAIAMAGVTGYITEASDGTVYQYDYNELKASYTNHVLGLAGDELYLHYENNKESVKAVYDGETGEYVDFEAMSQAYLDLALAGNASSFDMNDYAASDEAVAAEMPATVQAITINEAGEVVETTETVSQVEEVTVTAINAIDDVNVAYGTAFADVTLPATITATLSDEATADYAVEWAEGDYDGNTAATYALIGTITVTGDVTNPNAKTAAVNVVVAGEDQKTVSNVATIADISVANGTAIADAGLPATVEVTLSDDATGDAAVTWDGGTPAYEAATAGTYAFVGTLDVSALKNVAATSLTAAVNVVVADVALAVSSVSATNATTVEVVFNQAPAADATLTYTVGGTAYTPVMDGATATLTVATLVDDAATAVIVNDGTADLYNATVTYDINEATKLTVETVDMSQTVGEDFTLTVKLVDEDDDVMANEALTMNVTPGVATNDAKTLTATTNAEGLATFTWTRSNPDTAGETLDAYVNSRPVVRVPPGTTVQWLTTLKLVSVDQMAAQTLGLGTAVEYVVTAQSSTGAAYTGNLGVMYSGTAAVDANIVGEYKNAAGAWTVLTQGGADAYEDSLALTAANTGTDGQITFRFYSENAGTTDFQPIFYQDTDAVGGNANTMQTTESRVVGGTVNYVAQVPTFTWTAANAVTTIATTIDPNDATATNHTKVYTLKAVDQYGNPFRGTVQIYEYKAADNAALTTPTTTFRAALDTNNDGDYIDAKDKAAAVSQSINFALSAAAVPEASGDTITVQISDGAASTEIVKAVVFYDNVTAIAGVPDVANAYDTNDAAAFTDELTFAVRIPTTIEASKITEADEIAVGASADYLFTFKDQFGAKVATTTTKTIEAVVAGANIGSIVIATIDESYTAPYAATVAGINAVSTTQDSVTGTANNIAVRVDGGAANNQATLRVYIDTDDNGSFTPDEINATITTAKYVGAVATTGVITGDFKAGNLVGPAAVNAAKGTGYEFVGAAAVTATNELQLHYTINDQDDQDFDTTAAAIDVKWTIVNNGTTTAEYGNATDPGSQIAAGETKTVTIASTQANPGVSTLFVGSTDAATVANLTVTAEIVGKAGSEKSVKAVYVLPANSITAAANPVDQTISGTIVGIQKDGDNNATIAITDGTVLVIQSSFGDLYTIAIPNGAWANAGKLTIDGASVPGESQLESETYGVKLNQSISMTFDGTVGNYTGDVITITN